MIHESSAGIMDAIFGSAEVDARSQLLRIMSNFLLSEVAKHTAIERGANTFIE